MKDLASINENELDGALNALFLESYSQKADEAMARFCLEQEYQVTINLKKEAELLARLNEKRGGGKNILLLILGCFVIVLSSLFVFKGKGTDQPAGGISKKIIVAPQEITNSIPEVNSGAIVSDPATSAPSGQETSGLKIPVTSSPLSPVAVQEKLSPADSSQPLPFVQEGNKDPMEEKILPYFNKEGLAYFAKVKEKMLQKLITIDDQLYSKIAPGVTMYKSREVLVSPFVMSNFPVTNLQYKTFLADLATQGRVDELKKCLPKGEVWKEYGCITLAKNYFENESYNDFPVVNIEKEACVIFCEWLEEETNQKLAEFIQPSKVKGTLKKKEVVVRLPYDYEWIYSADAAYTLIPDCVGYNTIYDASEGLVDKGFFKRTSQVNKRDLRNETRMDKLADVNRFGMTEVEMTSIFKEAINYKDGNSKSSGNSSDPSSYPNNIEACCLAGHVCELIKDKEGGMKVRGCCWKNKGEYLKMMEAYKKNGASPFIGFRVMILNAEKGTDKNPFW